MSVTLAVRNSTVKRCLHDDTCTKASAYMYHHDIVSLSTHLVANSEPVRHPTRRQSWMPENVALSKSTTNFHRMCLLFPVYAVKTIKVTQLHIHVLYYTLGYAADVTVKSTFLPENMMYTPVICANPVAVTSHDFCVAYKQLT